ncbi:MAG: M3 family oligoendopeptidase [Leptospiraceae bacterium]|nr:M3 family oligoendopeptidase [Leptospiraceae bacterium]
MIDLNRVFQRNYLDKKFVPSEEAELQKAYEVLLERTIHSKEDLITFLEHWSELGSIIDEVGSLAYVNMTCNTEDKKQEELYLHMVEKIYPICHVYEDKVKNKFLTSEFLDELDKDYYGLFIKQTQTEKEIFREENTSLYTKDSVLSQEYQKITGGWMVTFEGREYTVQQMLVYGESKDREIREKAYRARMDVHVKDIEKLENLYDEMLITRNKIATNAGFKNFRDYKFTANLRFDYTPDDCLRFHDAIAETIVPLLTEWNRTKCSKLGIDSLRPWDLYVDPDSEGIIEAFKTEDEFTEKLEKVFTDVNPDLGKYFHFMRVNKYLDLSSRKGKAPGGYMTELSELRVPFIFMNAVGSKRDVETLLHEGGHAFHAFQASEQTLKSYRSSPLEFAEVASMSMELLGRPYLHHVYSEKDLQRVKIEQLTKIVEFFPFMSMIDSFQHWVYSTPKNGRVERGDKWLELGKKFQPFLDMSGMETIARTRWQYPHVYTVPFYYIEYGIAQIGALQVWKNSLKNEKNAIQEYLNGLTLGGSKSLPELFQAAGIRFAMDKSTLSELIDTIKRELDK